MLGAVDFDKRIEEKPFCLRWTTEGGAEFISDEGKINFEGLNDYDKLCLHIYAWNSNDILASKKGILKRFGWTNYKLQKMIKNLNGIIKVETAFSEETGLISGRGYLYCA